MALPAATLVTRVRQLLGDNPWATTGSSASASSVIAVPDGTKWDEAAIMEFPAGEQAWVQSVSGNNITAIRGFNSTTAAVQPAASVIFRDPTFTYKTITDGIDLALQVLWPFAYKKVSQNITPVATQPYKWYDLASTALALIDARQVNTTVTPNRLHAYGTRGSGLPIAFASNLPTALVASGTGVQFPRGFAETTDAVTVNYAAKLTATQVSSSYSDLSDGILAEIVTYSCAARLAIASDVPRATQMDTSMGDYSVVPGARSSIGRQLYQQYLILRNQYWDELRRTMPFAGNAPGGNRTSYGSGPGGYNNAPYP